MRRKNDAGVRYRSWSCLRMNDDELGIVAPAQNASDRSAIDAKSASPFEGERTPDRRSGSHPSMQQMACSVVIIDRRFRAV
jgi:hypothetical protein